jgi:hypothetical protein
MIQVAFSRCEPLEAYWQVTPHPETVRALRLSRDPEGRELSKTPLEREAEARAAAEQRIRQLEAELVERDRG